MRQISLAVIMLLVLAAGMAGAQVVGTAQIHAPAVVLLNNTGTVTVINLTVTHGNGVVTVSGPAEVANSTLSSARTAAEAGTAFLGLNFNSYNFSYYIRDRLANVSGPSAGGAMTMLAISALSGRPLRTGFTMTGTISSNGSIGVVGGVYDKVAAARASGLNLVLVPAVPSASFEDELYLLIQTAFGMPLVQVSNVSQAYAYAFSQLSGVPNETAYNFSSINYHASRLPQASIKCSNTCNESAFDSLDAYTINFTSNAISSLAAVPGFYSVAQQMRDVLDQSTGLAAKGYAYASADVAFLDYINSYMFLHYNATKQSGLQTLNSLNSYCSSLTPPQLTSTNYEYVIGGELRQAWAEYTLNSTIGAYNATAIDTDGVLQDLYAGGEASGWCSAANYMYGIAGKLKGRAVAVPASLSSLAQARIARAEPYGIGLYLNTANLAYAHGNYPVAILSADYAYAFGSPINMSTPAMLSTAKALAENATYGVWASQFANEAMADYYNAETTTNTSSAHTYAVDAYQTALLASQLSNDTNNIQSTFSQPQTTTIAPIVVPPQPSQLHPSDIVVIYLLIALTIAVSTILYAAFTYRPKPRRGRPRHRRSRR